MRLLVGLGNPGKEYQRTRHNLGFYCVDSVVEALGASWKAFKGGELAELSLEGQKVLIFKPMQFMNLSGVSLRQVVEYYGVKSEDMAIVADDVYVAPGSARIRKSGGDGGHNGWKSVLEHIEPDIFWRIKIGAGIYEQHPDKRKHMPHMDEYVLERMPKHDEKRAHDLIDKLVPNLIEWLKHGTGLTDETVHL